MNFNEIAVQNRISKAVQDFPGLSNQVGIDTSASRRSISDNPSRIDAIRKSELRLTPRVRLSLGQQPASHSFQNLGTFRTRHG